MPRDSQPPIDANRGLDQEGATFAVGQNEFMACNGWNAR